MMPVFQRGGGGAFLRVSELPRSNKNPRAPQPAAVGANPSALALFRALLLTLSFSCTSYLPASPSCSLAGLYSGDPGCVGPLHDDRELLPSLISQSYNFKELHW